MKFFFDSTGLKVMPYLVHKLKRHALQNSAEQLLSRGQANIFCLIIHLLKNDFISEKLEKYLNFFYFKYEITRQASQDFTP